MHSTVLCINGKYSTCMDSTYSTHSLGWLWPFLVQVDLGCGRGALLVELFSVHT